MNKNESHDNDFALFKEAVTGIKKMTQDTIIQRPKKNQIQKEITRSIRERVDHEFYFSDDFVPHLNQDGPTHYVRDGVSKYEAKRLRRGVYVPDVFLDMHGMTQQEAKRELAAMISHCIREHVNCASVMHGIGKQVLKQKVPLWLAQHPDVLAFHQAPLEFGGNGALLVLLSIPEK